MPRQPAHLIICSPVRSSFEVQEDPEVYRKEVIYPGHFVKKDARGNVEFELPVDEQLIDHWVATFNKMKANGVDVPLPIEHTTDPEQRRGTVVDLKKEYNEERKAPSLYMYVRFRDPKTAAHYSRMSQVSLFSPPDFVDGRGNKYMRPIKHVALTDYPLIPGLGKFEKTIAASLVLNEASAMTIAECAERLGIEIPEGADDETAFAAIEEAWNSPADDEENMDDPLADDAELDALEDEENLEEDDEDLGAAFEDEEDEEDEEDMGPPAASLAPVSASVARTVLRARTIQLDGLIKSGHITPAQRDKLRAKYCTQQRVSIALSHETAGGEGDGFDEIVAALASGPGLAFSHRSRTGPQHAGGGERSPLVADAERRSKEARNRR